MGNFQQRNGNNKKMSKGMLEINLPPYTVTEMKNILTGSSVLTHPRKALVNLNIGQYTLLRWKQKRKLLKTFLKEQSTQKILAHISVKYAT